jgi:hypothetical protein
MRASSPSCATGFKDVRRPRQDGQSTAACRADRIMTSVIPALALVTTAATRKKTRGERKRASILDSGRLGRRKGRERRRHERERQVLIEKENPRIHLSQPEDELSTQAVLERPGERVGNQRVVS